MTAEDSKVTDAAHLESCISTPLCCRWCRSSLTAGATVCSQCNLHQQSIVRWAPIYFPVGFLILTILGSWFAYQQVEAVSEEAIRAGAAYEASQRAYNTSQENLESLILTQNELSSTHSNLQQLLSRANSFEREIGDLVNGITSAEVDLNALEKMYEDLEKQSEDVSKAVEAAALEQHMNLEGLRSEATKIRSDIKTAADLVYINFYNEAHSGSTGLTLGIRGNERLVETDSPLAYYPASFCDENYRLPKSVREGDWNCFGMLGAWKASLAAQSSLALELKEIMSEESWNRVFPWHLCERIVTVRRQQVAFKDAILSSRRNHRFARYVALLEEAAEEEIAKFDHIVGGCDSLFNSGHRSKEFRLGNWAIGEVYSVWNIELAKSLIKARRDAGIEIPLSLQKAPEDKLVDVSTLLKEGGDSYPAQNSILPWAIGLSDSLGCAKIFKLDSRKECLYEWREDSDPIWVIEPLE